MVGFYLFSGKQGSGKTLMQTKIAFDNYEENPTLKVFSNYELKGMPFCYVTFNSEIEVNKEKLDILTQLDEDPDFFNNSIMLLDEIHLYLDSLDFMRRNNRRLQTFFSQLRKRNILLLGTTQYVMNLDIRIRRQCMNVIEMKHIKKDIFQSDTYDIDGYYTEFKNSHLIDLSGYYDKYNTFELIL